MTDAPTTAAAARALARTAPTYYGGGSDRRPHLAGQAEAAASALDLLGGYAMGNSSLDEVDEILTDLFDVSPALPGERHREVFLTTFAAGVEMLRSAAALPR